MKTFQLDAASAAAAKARRLRQIRAEAARYNAGLHTYMTKKYGSNYCSHEGDAQEFDEWLESKRDY